MATRQITSRVVANATRARGTPTGASLNNPRFSSATTRRVLGNGPTASPRRMSANVRLRTTLALSPVQRMNRQFQRLAGMSGG
jgi:hypothetical protein